MNRDLEAHFTDRLQVVRESLRKLLDGVHLEGEAEALGHSVEGDIEVTRRGIFVLGLVPEVNLVPFEEHGPVSLVDVERRALNFRL